VAGQPTCHAQQFRQSSQCELSLINHRGSLISVLAGSARRGMLRAAAGRGRATSLPPKRQWVLSLGIIVVFGVLGWSALPRDVTATSAALVVRDPAANGAGIGPAVFVLRDNGTAVRFGNAALVAGGAIRVGFYDPLDPLLGHATEAVSLPGDPRLLWLLASPAERQALRDGTADLALALSQSSFAVLRSPEFVNDYRDRLVQLLRADLETAWQTTRKSGAWQDLMRGYEPILRDTASRDLRPVIESHFRGVPMRMLRANALQMIDPFHAAEWNLLPVEDALQAAIQEIREREVPERTASRLLQAPPTAAFLRVFLDAMAGALAHDTALKDLVGEMVFDDRFRPYLNIASAKAMDLARIAPRLLVSLHGSTDLNPVASFVIRTLVSARSDRAVVFMSPAQRDELEALDPASVHPLVRAGAP
jgi:hypothetical protein